ncbi:MAG: 16S rRNA (uracil(1498)-N(3))-methyltransferase [Treponema sp.]|nr:16S rRNA (uracil(1498)-N(3))-methyltransferase [Treponema sp.]
MNICLFTPEEITKPLSLKDERAKHIIKILHKEVGQTFNAGVINQKAGIATITDITDTSLSFTFVPQSEGKPLYPLIMIIGFPRPIQLKRLLRDIAALGVSQVHLTGTELGEKSYMQSNLVEHGTAYQMLVDGTVQAASTHVPELFLHKTLKECLASIKTNNSQLKLCLDNINPSGSLNNILQNNAASSYIAAIGSERGWTNTERQLLEESGFIRCGMGPRIMRTETAATVSASIISAHAGWMD